MPRRKGYGIPPTKRIKIDDETENDENETNNTSCENANNDTQKTQNENYVKKTESNGSEPCPNNATANGIKYLHKKFKKMAAILTDDCAPTNPPPLMAIVGGAEISNGSEKSVYISTASSIAACSPVAPLSCSPNVMTAAVATTTVAATLPFEDKSGVPAVIGRHACPYCKLVCNKPSVLQKHIRAHTNERPYPCLPCGFAFKTRSNLYKHCRSRSHSLKLEEVNDGNSNVSSGSVSSEGDPKVFAVQEEEADEEDESQNVLKDEDSASSEEKTEQPRKSIYKPKFHKAAIYIQNSGSAPSPTIKSEQLAPSSTLNKFGLQLKIPTTATTIQQSSSRSTPSTPSSFNGSSPSPEFLQRHISKLISENQAIVETTDPFWSRKFYQRGKESSSPLNSPLFNAMATTTTAISSPSLSLSFEQLEKKQQTQSQPQPQQQSVDVLGEKISSISKSKLANALLQPRPVTKSISMNDINCSSTNGGAPAVEESQPLNLTMSKFVRPTSLPLQPGTFVPKKLIPGTVAVLPLISPETPRPNKSYGQLYIGGNAYTYLGLKCSTRSTFCTLHKSQPTYVPLSPEHNKISMYSNWKVRSEADPYLRNMSATKAMACYDSRQRYSPYTVVYGKMKDAVTHSSYWAKRAKLKGATSSNKGDSDEENKENKTQVKHVQEGLDGLVTNAAGDEEEDGEDDENEDDYTENDPKCQLEREVAKSLLSLSKISHQTVSEQYANAGLVPLNTRPNTYPYNYSAITYLSSKPHTPTLTLISEQKERETVSKNTGLARELQPTTKPGQMIKQKCDPSAQSSDRYYFGSSSEMEVTKTVSDLQESVIKDSVTITSVFPIDLSSKNASIERRILLPTAVSNANTIGGYSEVSSAGISEILTPVSEPVLLATICSTIDRLSAVTGGTAPPSLSSPVSNPTDATEGSVMLQTYLKERAVQDLKIKQQYQSPHIKNEKRDFEVKFNVYNEAFQKGAAMAAANVGHTSLPAVDKADDGHVRPPPSLKRKAHLVYENDTDKTFVARNKAKGVDRVSDSDSKENFAVTPDEPEKGDGSTSVIILVGSPNSGTNNSPKKLKAEFISPCNGPLPKYASVLEDGRSKCVVCNKVFSKPSQLRLHVNIHYFEQPFRCEACAVSFRTKGHLHKHLGSNSHLNKVSMNSAGNGQTSTNNPRPFKCDDCGVGFRIHGHLAKHLRSKMHIMKLECLGKLPFGTYAEMERCGINMNDIDTTDCENSLESLQRIAKGVVGSVMYVNNADEEGGKMIADNASF